MGGKPMKYKIVEPFSPENAYFELHWDDGKTINTCTVQGYAGAGVGCFAYFMSAIMLQIEQKAPLVKDYYASGAIVPKEFEATEELIQRCVNYLIHTASKKVTPAPYPAPFQPWPDRIVILGDAMNHGTSVKYPTTQAGGHWAVAGTGRFVEQLIKHKIGTVYASPILRNPSHSSKGDCSLCQVWLWIPPEAKGICIPHSAGVFNLEETTREDWAKTVSKPWGEIRTWDEMIRLAMNPSSPFFQNALAPEEHPKSSPA